MCVSRSHCGGWQRMPSESPQKASCAYLKEYEKCGCIFVLILGWGDVTNSNTRYAVKVAARALNYPKRAIPLQRIHKHSLRSGWVCSLALAGSKDRDIIEMGRWAQKSHASMEYIQQQLSIFSAGMSTIVNKVARLTNMEGSVVNEDLRATTVF